MLKRLVRYTNKRTKTVFLYRKSYPVDFIHSNMSSFKKYIQTFGNGGLLSQPRSEDSWKQTPTKQTIIRSTFYSNRDLDNHSLIFC